MGVVGCDITTSLTASQVRGKRKREKTIKTKKKGGTAGIFFWLLVFHRPSSRLIVKCETWHTSFFPPLNIYQEKTHLTAIKEEEEGFLSFFFLFPCFKYQQTLKRNKRGKVRGGLLTLTVIIIIILLVVGILGCLRFLL